MKLHGKNYAIYLPAVNTSYATTVANPLPQGRRFPSGLTPKDLMFWEPNNNWHYPYLLHSIGQYSVGTKPHSIFDKTSRSSSTLIGDSGGFQIGRGTLKGMKHVKSRLMNPLHAVDSWCKENETRKWIVDWLGQECDYAMTIDMPLWAVTKNGVDSPFHHCTSEQLIAMTVQNLKYIHSFSKSNSKWLNVVQGGPLFSDTLIWWDNVKWFRKGGWALAGSAGYAGGLYKMLVVLMMMRDEGAFEEGQDWLHVLGVSTPFWAVVLTEIQNGLRRMNPNLKVSFDTSSPFQLGGRYEDVALSPVFDTTTSSWTIKTVKAPQLPSYAKADCKVQFPHQQSPIGKVLMMNELCIHDDMWRPRSFDSLSNALLVNHNVWVYLDAFKQANDLVACRNVSRIPPEYLQCLDFIKQLFSTSGDWKFELDKHQTLLNKVAPYCL